MTKKIRIPYFPKELQYLTPLIFGVGIYLAIIGYALWTIVLMLIGVIILTTGYVTEINLKEKKCRDYLFLLGFSINEDSKVFNSLDRIVITKENYAQTINTRSRSRQLDWSDYTGTLIIDNNDTLVLLTRNDKNELLKALKEFADFLHVEVEDRTTDRPYWIDMTKI